MLRFVLATFVTGGCYALWLIFRGLVTGRMRALSGVRWSVADWADSPPLFILCAAYNVFVITIAVTAVLMATGKI
jgi:hypothetical protein